MRVLTIRESVWLNVTPGTAWRRILSLEEWSTWNTGVARAQWVGRRGWRPGNRFRLVARESRSARFAGVIGRATGTGITGGIVVRVESDRAVGWAGRLLGTRVEHTLAVTTEGVGTRVEFATTVRGLAVRLIGQDGVIRGVAREQRRFLADLRVADERVGAALPWATLPPAGNGLFLR